MDSNSTAINLDMPLIIVEMPRVVKFDHSTHFSLSFLSQQTLYIQTDRISTEKKLPTSRKRDIICIKGTPGL